MKRILLIIGCIALFTTLYGQEIPSLKYFRDGIKHWQMQHPEGSYPRWDETDFIHIADNIVAYQNEDGGWMKNIDWLAKLNPDSVIASLTPKRRRSTIDNRNVIPQITYLADVYQRTGNEKYRQAAERGIEYIINTQKENGGWRGWDADAITFNDDVTTNVMQFLCDVVQGDPLFKWLSRDDINHIAAAYHKGIDVILRCQVVQNGVKTIWAQQHDNITYEPVKARSYELPGLSAPESSQILLMLMSIDNPSQEVKEAITCGVKWMWNNRIEGIKVEKIVIGTDSVTGKNIYDRVVVKDSTVRRPIWARYYNLENNKPFFCRRSGEKVWRLADVDYERRIGYGWYGRQPMEVLKEYPDWAERMGVPFTGFDNM